MDWFADFMEIAQKESNIMELRKKQFTGHIEIHFYQGSVKVVKVQHEIRI